MTQPAIRVEHLSKQYHIGRRLEKHRTLRDALVDGLAAPFRRAARLLRGHATGAAEWDDTIWALKDVSFEIGRGEKVGLIGRNGAGKSTLLKVLSRITEPTEGYAQIRGRVGSLLEVGTGFHPELTGRENIYLNGAILGMRRVEIDGKFDEIVSFAEVEKFIDTPVKHYSSGMRLRLGFAVAAHLEPEILLVDEVLAVGDANFQKRCLNKMEDVGQQGRTVIFVSHSMTAITRLCERALLLDQGRLVEDGPSPHVVGSYLGSGAGTTAACEWPDLNRAPGNQIVRLRAMRIRTKAGHIAEVADIREPVGLEIEYQVLEPDKLLIPFLYVSNGEGIRVFSAVDQDPEWRGRPRPVGHYVSTAWVPGNLLTEGMFYLSSVIRSPELSIRHLHVSEAVAFQVVDGLDGDSARADYGGPMHGIVRPMLEWETQFSRNGDGPILSQAEAGHTVEIQDELS
jgi:lipopolysaccharide transport system ATP-binding protein